MTQSQPPPAPQPVPAEIVAAHNEFKSTNPKGPIVLFATPAYGGLQPMAVASLVNTMRDLAAHGFRTQPYWSVNCSIITNAREELIGVARLSHADWVVMTDNDVGYPADLVRRMIRFGAPMMAAAVPYRTIDVSEIEATGRYYEGIQFNLTPMDVEELKKRERKDGFLKLSGKDGVGAAFMVMSRGMIDVMCSRYPDLATASSPEIQTYALFHQFLDQSRHWGEDTSFMRRWHELQGETWVCLDAQVTHTGPMTLGGNLMRALEGLDDPEAKRMLKGASGHILRDLKKRADPLPAAAVAVPALQVAKPAEAETKAAIADLVPAPAAAAVSTPQANSEPPPDVTPAVAGAAQPSG